MRNIGEPQPEIAALIRQVKLRSEVLDAGCGIGETSLALAAHGYTAVGIDVAPTAITTAQQAAEERGLCNVTFVADDIRTFAGYDGRFDTVLDSALFHSLPVEARDNYLRSVHQAAAPGASFYVLVFSTAVSRPDSRFPFPNVVTEAELREAVSKYWKIDEIRPAFIHAHLPQLPGMPYRDYDLDETGRQKAPAFLLTAHKAN